MKDDLKWIYLSIESHDASTIASTLPSSQETFSTLDSSTNHWRTYQCLRDKPWGLLVRKLHSPARSRRIGIHRGLTRGMPSRIMEKAEALSSLMTSKCNGWETKWQTSVAMSERCAVYWKLHYFTWLRTLLFFNSNRSASSFLYVYFIGTVLMTIDTTKFGCCVLFLALTLYVPCSYSTTALVQISNLKYVKMYKFWGSELPQVRLKIKE